MQPNSPLPASDPLFAHLPAENAAWESLLNVLEQEEQALVEGEADLLPRFSALKMAQMRTLNTLAQERHDALQAAGLTSDPDGMSHWLSHQGKPEHSIQWEKLQTMELQAQALNQRIGVLIEMRLNSTRQALNVLVQAAKSQGGLYDQGGCSVASRNGKPLTAA